MEIDQQQVTIEIEDLTAINRVRRTSSMRNNRRIVEQTNDTNVIEERNVDPIIEYADEPLLYIEEACAPLENLIENLSYYIEMALNETPSKPANDLTIEESAAIRLYTIEWAEQRQSLYFQLNQVLISGDRQRLRPYFKYMKLFLTGLAKIPCSPPLTVWRGVNQNLSTQFPKGTPVTWWRFSSCTTSIDVFNDTMFLGKDGDRTLFSIEAINARSIREHSHFAAEDEILLLPGTHMIVQSQLFQSPNIHIIHLKQIQPNQILLKAPFKGSHIYPKLNQSVKRHWWSMKRFFISICLLALLVILAIILGVVLGTKSNNTNTIVNMSTGDSSPPQLSSSQFDGKLTSSSLTYQRPGSSLSDGLFYYYSTELNVERSGYYLISSSSNIDTYGSIYNNSFNPSLPNENLLQQNNDDAGKNQFRLNLTLISSRKYILVVTTNGPRVVGDFLIIANGFGLMNFSTSSLTQTNQYSSLLTSDNLNYCLNGSCDSFKLYYEVIPLTISINGNYKITSNSTFDTYGLIYRDNFNPNALSLNLIMENNDDDGNNQFLWNIYLQVSIQYLIVVTTSTNRTTGSFTISINGPGNIRFSQTGIKYSYTSTLYLTSSSLSYCRISNCATGVLYYYTSISLNVPTNGYYTIKTSSLLDTYGYIYNNSFYSYAPTVNLLEQNDDGAGNKQFLLNMFFDASMSYIMIVTTYDPNQVGSFEIVVTGPDSMYFLDISTTYTYIFSSMLSSSSSYYCRIGNCSLGIIYYYEVHSLTVATNGYYTITSNSTFDSYGLIYRDNFNPSMPNVNLLQQNDDGAGNHQFLLRLFLQTSLSYELVVTTYASTVIGSFSISSIGPALALLN